MDQLFHFATLQGSAQHTLAALQTTGWIEFDNFSKKCYKDSSVPTTNGVGGSQKLKEE